MADGVGTATLVPYQGSLWVDRDPWSGAFVLSHAISKERRVYEGFSEVYLEYIDDDAVLVCHPEGDEGESPHEFRCLEQELCLVYDAGEGRTLLVLDDSASPRSLEELNREHKPVRVSFLCGPRGEECWLEVGVFARPLYGGLRVRWNLHEMFDRLSLRCHRGERWNWVSKNWFVWTTFASELFPDSADSFAKGLLPDHLETSQSKASGPLSWPSCTSALLVGLLARFCMSSSAQAGRFRDEDACRAADELLEGVLKSLAGTAWQMQLLVDSKASLRWPRPPHGANAISLSVDVCLTVDIGIPWAEVEKPQDACVKFFNDLWLTHGSQLPLTGLLHDLVCWRPRSISARHSLLGQVLMQIGLQLEVLVIRALERPGSPQDKLQAVPMNYDPAHESVESTSRFLVRYHQAQLRTFETVPQYLSLASDKSRVLGTTLMQTSLTLPDNRALWCFPVVLCESSHSTTEHRQDASRTRWRRRIRRFGGDRAEPLASAFPARIGVSNMVRVIFGPRVFSGIPAISAFRRPTQTMYDSPSAAGNRPPGPRPRRLRHIWSACLFRLVGRRF